MTFSIKDMERRIEWLKARETDLRNGSGPVASLSPLAAANTLDEAIKIIAELAGRLSASEEIKEYKKLALAAAKKREEGTL